MPASMSNVAIQQFRDIFTNVYQGTAFLGDTTQSVFGAEGDAYKWPVQGQVLSVERGAYQSYLQIQDNDYSQVTTLFKNWTINLPVDVFQQKELNIDMIRGLAPVHAKSMQRREDQTVLDALVAAPIAPANIIVDGGTNMTVAKLRQAKTQLDLLNVDYEDRFLVMTPSQQDSLIADPIVTSVLSNTVRSAVTGNIEYFMGFKIYVIGEREEGGLPIAANIRSCFVWQRESMGRVYQMTPEVTVDWQPATQSWLTISKMRLGASNLLPKGIVEIQCDEAAAP
tara:strand:+ start:685 stop:1530 length:846 start_codon:yes stop_codon:yes gene_type:complete